MYVSYKAQDNTKSMYERDHIGVLVCMQVKYNTVRIVLLFMSLLRRKTIQSLFMIGIILVCWFASE